MHTNAYAHAICRDIIIQEAARWLKENPDILTLDIDRTTGYAQHKRVYVRDGGYEDDAAAAEVADACGSVACDSVAGGSVACDFAGWGLVAVA